MKSYFAALLGIAIGHLLVIEAQAQCPCTIPSWAARMEGNGKQHKVVIDQSISNATFISNINWSISSWQTEENFYPKMPKIGNYNVTPKLTFKFDNRTSFYTSSPNNCGTTTTACAVRVNVDTFMIVYFNDKNPLSMNADNVIRLTSHELGHLHALGHATGVNCTAQDSVMKLPGPHLNKNPKDLKEFAHRVG